MNPTASGVRLDAHIAHVGSALRVEYTLHNQSGHEIGVFNRIPVVRADGSTDATLAHAYVSPSDTGLQLAAQELPLPGEGIAIAARMTPYVSRVADGATLRDEFVLPEPVVANDPYRMIALAAAHPGAPVTADAAHDVTAVTLTVGFFPVVDGVRLLPVSPAYPDVYRVYPATYHQTVLDQRVQLERPLRVLDYRAGHGQ